MKRSSFCDAGVLHERLKSGQIFDHFPPGTRTHAIHQGCGSGSVSGSGLDPYPVPDSIGSVDPDPDPGGQK